MCVNMQLTTKTKKGFVVFFLKRPLMRLLQQQLQLNRYVPKND